MQCLFLLLLLALLACCKSFLLKAHCWRPALRLAGSSNGISLASLTSHAKDAERLAALISDALDTEYVSLAVHQTIGDAVAHSYKASRKSGVTDLETLLQAVSSHLTDTADLKGAAVQVWDIVSKAHAALLSMLQAKPAPAAALGAIHACVDLRRVKALSLTLSDQFNRYQFIRRFLMDEESWADMDIAAALVLGFRINYHALRLEQVEALAPKRWIGLEKPFAFNNTAHAALDDRMRRDLSEDQAANEVIFEAVAGVDHYIQMKRSTDLLVQRKLLLVQWLYAHGVLADTFPHTERFDTKDQYEFISTEEEEEEDDGE